MSSPCLSSVLTTANLTVYQTGLTDVLQPSMQDSTHLGCSRTSAASYRLSSPPCWSEDQVLEWLSDHVESSRLDASALSLSLCAVDGFTLCQMKVEQMTTIFGPQLGPQLHQNLQDLRSRHEVQSLSGPELSETCQLLDNFLDNLSFPLLSTIKIGAVEHRQDFGLHNYDLTSVTLEPPPLNEYLSDGECMSPYNDSGSNESDPELSCHLISKLHIKVEKEETPVKRPRGRPPKVIHQRGSIFSSPKKTKHAPRGTHLWEFIRDILIHPEKNQGLMKWEDRHEGVFKFLKSEAVAQMWGQKKRNSSMTYEKLSRAMRYYYKRDILERVDGRRLVYKFGKNSSGWKIEEIGLHIQSQPTGGNH